MAHSVYNRGAGFIQRTTAKSIDVKNELDAISAGFDLLPKPRDDGKGFKVPVAVADATEVYHAITKGQLDTLIGSNAQNKTDSEAARNASYSARDVAVDAKTIVLAQKNHVIEWATALENVAVSVDAGGGAGKYSSLHWAAKASSSAQEAQASANIATGLAATFNVPPIFAGDTGKALMVKPDLSGFVLTDARPSTANLILNGVI
jgi:hypothetical protein